VRATPEINGPKRRTRKPLHREPHCGLAGALRGLCALSIAFTGAFISGCEGNPGAPGVSRLPHDLYPPSVEVVLPLASRPLRERAIIEALVSDDDSVAAVEFFVDGAPAAVGTIVSFHPPTQYAWDCSALPLGPHTLQLQATDRAGKSGVSTMLYLNRSEQIEGVRDTLRFFADVSNNAIIWKFPTDSLAGYSGVGVRFTPDKPVKIYFIGVKFRRQTAWRGAQAVMWIELSTVRDGLPDTLVSRREMGLRDPRDGNYDYNDWLIKPYATGVYFGGEFIVTLTYAPDQQSDTVAVQTDDGLWKNGHGLMRTPEGEWKPFVSGRGRLYNPLIFAVVEYQ